MFAGFARFVKPVPWYRCEGEFWAWWIHEKDDVSVSDTGGSEEKNRVLVIGVERMTFWLPVSVASLVFCSSVVDGMMPLYHWATEDWDFVWFVGGNTRDIALQLVWRQCCKTSFSFCCPFYFSFRHHVFIQIPAFPSSCLIGNGRQGLM